MILKILFQISIKFRDYILSLRIFYYKFDEWKNSFKNRDYL